jgi:hypothetical protein
VLHFTGLDLIYPNTLLIPMAKPISDHVPCFVQIGTRIPKAKVFRFENFWMQHPGFLELVEESWGSSIQSQNAASRIAAKFKNLRRSLKHWSKGISKISILIQRYNEVISIGSNLSRMRKAGNFLNMRKKLQSYGTLIKEEWGNPPTQS